MIRNSHQRRGSKKAGPKPEGILAQRLESCWEPLDISSIPYLYNGHMHDYVPDFLVRLKSQPQNYLILETKGYDLLEEVKRAAAERWVAAVNADGAYGRWQYMIAKRVPDIATVVSSAAS